MTKFLTIFLSLFTILIVSAQPNVTISNPLPNAALDRNVAVTVYFNVKGVVFYDNTPLGLDFAENINSTITVTGGSPTNPTPVCSPGDGCYVVFTPTTQGNSASIVISGTADMQYGNDAIGFSNVTFNNRTVNYQVVGTLSVELLSFDAKSDKAGQAILEWVSSSEKNNSHFDIERSYDGVKFEKIGQVAGVGTSELENKYAFTDNQKAEGRLAYYRLNIVDHNGESRYSKVVVVYDKKGKLDIKSANEQVVNVEAADNGDLDMRIYSVNGQLVVSQTVAVTEGYNSVALNTQTLASGLYILHLNDGRERKTIKFVKN
ncbi:MAG: T9SS type A sorting domain-containing protein [Saprospiraceae bacterium]|nr:T9SS type A sorting domain-containing protein [Saprospiraceae bacterium]